MNRPLTVLAIWTLEALPFGLVAVGVVLLVSRLAKGE